MPRDLTDDQEPARSTLGKSRRWGKRKSKAAEGHPFDSWALLHLRYFVVLAIPSAEEAAGAVGGEKWQDPGQSVQNDSD
jgi:hypothetical protein